jgi:hypothetical protein
VPTTPYSPGRGTTAHSVLTAPDQQELLYSESNEQLERVMHTAQTQPADEMILEELEGELRKLHVTAAVVRPLISASQRDKYQSIASLELRSRRREQVKQSLRLN